MPAERGPSGTGHNTAGNESSDILAAPISTRDGEPIFPAPVAVPGPASEPHEFVGRLDRWCEVCNLPDRASIHIAAPVAADPVVSPAERERIETLERALRIIETEVYGRPEPFCRRIAAEIVEVLGVAPQIRLEASHRAYEVSEGGREDKCPLCGIERQNAGWIPETCGKHIHEPGCFVLPRAAGEGDT